MNKAFFLLALLSAWTTWPASLAAQEAGVIREGDRIRVTVAEYGGTLLVGEVMTRSPEALTVNRWQPTVRKWEVVDLPVDSISSLEVNRGTRSNAGKGALLGGVIGGSFGLAAGIAAASYDCNADPWDWDGCSYWGEAGIIPISTVTFGLLGAGVGALIGTLSRSDQWEPIHLDRLHVRIFPTSGGVALAFSVGF